ncbi:hypothetical protein MJOCIBJJ_00025 [Serratia phage KKP 3708]|uniref:HNS binding protein n=1 Tax=Serratia phage KKP 3708 TaxID=3041362 RepID=A0AA50IHN0_9CAUD|nr:hypothetical protein MJOCIBJJ_00025 [Serratia phage KKP 3708]
MGVNKQFRVSFDVTATMSNEQEQEFLEALKELAKGPRDPRQDNILVQALTFGPEGAIVAILKDGLREAIKNLGREVNSSELTIRFAPAEVRVKS